MLYGSPSTPSSSQEEVAGYFEVSKSCVGGAKVVAGSSAEGAKVVTGSSSKNYVTRAACEIDVGHVTKFIAEQVSMKFWLVRVWEGLKLWLF